MKLTNMYEKTDSFFEKCKTTCLNEIEHFKKYYGIIGIIASVLVAVKYAVFYNLMGIKDTALLIVLSVFFTGYIFKVFKNKYIPAVIYLLLCVLMFADVSYCSFFNKYLSVTMLNSIGILGTIKESIKEVIKPVNFLMLIDSVTIFAAVIRAKRVHGFNKENVINSKFDIKNVAVKLLPILLLIMLVFIGNAVPAVQGISKQEFFTYHIGDIITNTLDIKEKPMIRPFTDHYEDEKEGPLFGIGEGKNLVVIQIESFQDFVIGLEYNGQEVTPFLNDLLEDNTVHFDNYFQQVGSGNTSDAEFAANNSILGTTDYFTYNIYQNNYFRGLPWLLKDKGYETAVFHAYEGRDFWNRENAYPAMGFDTFYGGLIGNELSPGGTYQMTEWMGWGLTDTEFYPQSMKFIKDLKEPFYSFIITLSNHHPYIMLDHYNFIEIADEEKGTMVGDYLNSAAYTDYALSQLFDLFKKEGLYENTVFALYGDHMGLYDDEEINKAMDKFLGRKYDWDDRMNVPLLIHVPGEEENFSAVNHNYGGHLDFLPTIAYIMGFEHLDTVYLGHNLFNYSEGVVAQHQYLPYGSFFSDGYAMEMPMSGVFANARVWNRETREEVDSNDFYEQYMKSREVSDTSMYILRNDILRKIYEGDLSREDAFKVE